MIEIQELIDQISARIPEGTSVHAQQVPNEDAYRIRLVGPAGEVAAKVSGITMKVATPGAFACAIRSDLVRKYEIERVRQMNAEVFGEGSPAYTAAEFFNDLKKDINRPIFDDDCPPDTAYLLNTDYVRHDPIPLFVSQAQYDEYAAALETSPRFSSLLMSQLTPKEPAMYSTTITITRDDILLGEEWINEKVFALVPTGLPEFSPDQEFVDPHTGDLLFRIEAVAPDYDKVIIYNAGGPREETTISDLQDGWLRGEFV